MKIVLIGPAGSGKGTQAAKLSEKYGIPAISMGDLLRGEVKSGTETGRKIEGILAEGKLVPNEIPVALIKKRIQEKDCEKGFIADGFPRTMEQERMASIQFDHAISLEVPDGVVIKRLLGRGRHDDTEDAIRQRLEIYKKETKPLILHYGKAGILKKIGGTKGVDEVFREIVKALK